jgi:uncharacterized membrane protein YbhN (UPF0104 family)
MSFNWRPWACRATFLLVPLALAIVFNVLRHFTFDQIWKSLHRAGPRELALSALCAAGSYLALTGFDKLGVAYAGGRLPYRRIALASFLSVSIGHTVGFAPLSSGAMRFRYYSQWGLTARQIGLIVLLSVVTVASGELSLSAIALLLQPDLAAQVIGISREGALSIGAACAASVLAYLALAAGPRRPLGFRRWSLTLPHWRIAVGQVCIGLINYIFVAGVLHFLLSAVAPIDYFTTATAYILANLAALATHIPGGLGVLEAVIVTVLPGIDTIGPLIAFRIIYFLIPLGIGCLLFAVSELKQRRRGTGAELGP